MPLIQVNSRGETIDRSSAEVAACLAATPGAPVVVMIHGYKFRPGDPVHCPHRHILSLAPPRDCFKAVSWPRHLGVGRSRTGPEPLCIAFGWNARGSVWRAWAETLCAARALVLLLEAIRAQDVRRPVSVIAHSMGARVALRALEAAPRGAVDRVVLMAGAALRSEAAAALASPAGSCVEVVNATSRENDIFDAALETLLLASERTIGAGLETPRPNWLDIQFDEAGARSALRGLGFRIAPPKRRVCHWSAYLRPGLLSFYRAFLTRPEATPFAALADALPRRQSPRYSRLGRGLAGRAGQAAARLLHRPRIHLPANVLRDRVPRLPFLRGPGPAP